MFKKAIDQYIQDTIQVFQVWHNLCSEMTSMWTFKMYSCNTKTTNEPIASNNKSGEHLGQLKDLEISKYKRFFSLERPWNI